MLVLIFQLAKDARIACVYFLLLGVHSSILLTKFDNCNESTLP